MAKISEEMLSMRKSILPGSLSYQRSSTGAIIQVIKVFFQDWLKFILVTSAGNPDSNDLNIESAKDRSLPAENKSVFL